MSSMNIRFSEPVSTEGRARSERAGDAPPPCDKEASDLFMKKLEEREAGRHDLDSGASRHDESDKKPENVFSAAGMTSPLESLFAGRMEQQSPVAAPAAADPAELERLVERILVSTPESGGHEVRLSLGSHALPGTEITLQRNADGQLSVTLLTSDASSFQTLVASQNDLRQMLEKLENNNVRVTVTQNSDREDNDSRHRSRGYMEEETLRS